MSARDDRGRCSSRPLLAAVDRLPSRPGLGPMVERVLATLLTTSLVALCAVSPAPAHVGTGIAVDPKGRVWFADPSGNRVWRIETDGRVTRVASEIHSNVLVPAPD